jgi:hypothetical protein
MIIKSLYILGTFCVFAFTCSAQEDMDTPEEISGGIYQLNFSISEALRTIDKIENPNRNFGNSLSTVVSFSEALIDSIKVITEVQLSEKFEEKVGCVYKYSKKGKKLVSIGMNGGVEGMPTNTLSNSMKQNNVEHYISVSAMFDEGGVPVSMNGLRKSKIKPKLSIIVKVSDANKNVIYKEKITKKDYSKLRTKERRRGDLILTNSETLSPEDFVRMYEIALEELLQQ